MDTFFMAEHLADMPVERKLGAELEAIARDTTSGAAELALRALTALEAWLQRNPRPTGKNLLSVSRVFQAIQPSMAPFLRLSNELALAADTRQPTVSLAKSLSAFRKILERGPELISRQFRRALRGGHKWTVITYSYSSTVLRALIRARSRIKSVTCSEGRPGCEGRTTARKLAEAGLRIYFVTDALLASSFMSGDLFVVGADALLRGAFVNKVGTEAITRRALGDGMRVWVLADTFKLWPERPRECPWLTCCWKPTEELWERPPRGVILRNQYFEPTPFLPGVRLLTEQGWMTPGRLRREMGKIAVSPQLLPRGGPRRLTMPQGAAYRAMSHFLGVTR